MKKTLFLILVLATVLLSACFGKKDPDPRPAAQEASNSVLDQPAVAETPAASTPSKTPAPPSFQEGNFYLRAVQTRDLELCKKIDSQRLLERCEAQVQALIEKFEK